jgi:hypothetical protein
MEISKDIGEFIIQSLQKLVTKYASLISESVSDIESKRLEKQLWVIVLVIK